MKFSTRTTYGLRAMTSLARSFEQGPVSLATIAKNENISLAYLERIFSQLKKAKLVVAEKGASGGYALVQAPETISALEVVEALEGDLRPFRCIGRDGEVTCRAKRFCEVPKVLVKVQTAVVETLERIHLKDLI
jgi:Rrf2 family protein